MSAKVLTRIKTRKSEKYDKIARRTYMLLFLLLLGVNCYFRYRTYRLKNAPDWANWKLASSYDPSSNLNEQVRAFRSDGVPTTLLINGEQWWIFHVDHFTDGTADKTGSIMAETDCQNKIITYISSPNPAILKVNIMHEVFHAGDCLHGGDTYWNSEKPNGEDHPGIYHLGQFMSVFLHDNPQFAAWESN